LADIKDNVIILIKVLNGIKMFIVQLKLARKCFLILYYFPSHNNSR